MPNYSRKFQGSLASIESLIATPESIRELSLSHIDTILRIPRIGAAVQEKLNNLKQALSSISGGSIIANYTLIYNQSCVLAVSALSATLNDHFKNFANSNWRSIDPKVTESIKFSLNELRDRDLSIRSSIGEVLLEKDNSINLQDYNSILRTYRNYFGKNFDVPDDVRKAIILYSQYRHAIVHNDGVVDEKTLRRLSDAAPNGMRAGSRVSLIESDWTKIKYYFGEFISIITDNQRHKT